MDTQGVTGLTDAPGQPGLRPAEGRSTRAAIPPAYFVFFFLSGFAGLVYETVWVRLAMADFGVTTPTVSMVVSIFMAGLGLGGWAAGRLAEPMVAGGSVRLLRLYAGSEAVIALSAFLVPRLLGWGREALTATTISWNSSSYYLASAACVTLALLPWCVAMGATFPLAMAAMRAERGAAARTSFSFLYLANVLGGAAGTLLSAFALIELSGFRETLGIAGALNLTVALLAVGRSLRAQAGTPGPATDTAHAPRVAGTPPTGAVLAWLFVSGAVSMAMELVWIRQFTSYLGTVVYTFAIIVGVYLLATFLGSQLYRLRLGPGRPPVSPVFGWGLAGFLAVLPLVAADWRLPFEPVHRVVLGIGPLCAALGFLTPMLIDRWALGRPRQAGLAYGVNVLGSIVGPLVAGFWLLPAFGDRGALTALVPPLFVIGAVAVTSPALVAGVAPRSRLAAGGALVVAIVAAAVVIGTTEGYERTFPPGSLVRRDHTATVIATGTGRDKALVVNAHALTTMTPITKMMVHLPLAYLERPPERVLVIAFGMGTTFRSSVAWGVPTTAVELVPSVPALFNYYHADAADVLRAPDARVVVDDGRRFIERSTGTYDLITIDPPPPIESAGSSLLYSRQFYAAAKRRLRPDGILQQWFPNGDVVALVSVARALRESFPHVRVFRSVEGWGVHFLATTRPLPALTPAALAARVPPRAVADLIEWGPAASAEEQFARVLGRELDLGAIIALAPGVAGLDDDQPLTEYYFVRRGSIAPWR